MKLEDFLIQEEGDDSKHLANSDVAATWDALGHVWNIGPGLTQGVTAKTVWTPAQLAAAEAAEFAATRAAVASLVKVQLGENERTALESFTYNVGVHAFATSTVLRDVNRNDFVDVPAALREWNRAGGCVCKGLIKRREDEIRLFQLRDSDAPPADLKASKTAPPATRADDSLDVKGVQIALNGLMGPQLPSPLAEDGVFGRETSIALRMYQRDNGLTPDGVCGPLTTAKIRAALAAVPASPTISAPSKPQLLQLQTQRQLS